MLGEKRDVVGCDGEGGGEVVVCLRRWGARCFLRFGEGVRWGSLWEEWWWRWRFREGSLKRNFVGRGCALVVSGVGEVGVVVVSGGCAGGEVVIFVVWVM